MAETKALAGGAAATAAAGAAHVAITHFLWLDWSRIAIAQVAEVRRARESILEIRKAGGNWSEALSAEHSASLVAISACAHALDGLYGELKPLMTMPTLAKKASRHDYIRAAFGSAFKGTNADRSYWKTEFTWLHDLRDAAVHPVAKSRPSVRHPVHGGGSVEGARYCLESCERALTLLIDTLRRLASPEQAKTAAVKQYGEEMSGALESIMR
jgi:hypothetical protein